MKQCCICNIEVKQLRGWYPHFRDGYRHCEGCDRKYCLPCEKENNIKIDQIYICSRYNMKGCSTYCSNCSPPQVVLDGLRNIDQSRCSQCKIVHKNDCQYLECYLCNTLLCHDCYNKNLSKNNDLIEGYSQRQLLDKPICNKCIIKPSDLFDSLNIECNECQDIIHNELKLPYDDFIEVTKCNKCFNMYCWNCGSNHLHRTKINYQKHPKHISICSECSNSMTIN